MKIDSIEAFPVSMKIDEDLQGGTFRYTHYQTVLVRATVGGVEGWGEAMTRSDPDATALLVRFLANRICGKEFKSPDDSWSTLWQELRVRGHTRGVDVEALSGIEIALQDCFGKITRKPLAAIYSPNPVGNVAVFAGSLFESRGPLNRQVEEAKGSGLAGAKVKIGFGIEEDRRTLSLFRRLWADGMLVADANGAYDAKTARNACEAFERYHLEWFEEPVLSDDLAGYRALKKTGVTIGAGESWFPGDFEAPMEEGLVGVVEPSVSRCGGLGIEMDVASRASEKGIRFSPMTGMNSAVSLAASLQAASARDSVGVEYNPFPNPLQTELASGIEPPKEGRIRIPTGNGLGIEVDFRFVKAHSH